MYKKPIKASKHYYALTASGGTSLPSDRAHSKNNAKKYLTLDPNEAKG